MAIEPRPAAPGPIDFRQEFRVPAHIPTISPVEIPEHLLPEIDIEVRPDFDIIHSGEIPEVIPVFLGIRKVIAEQRIKKLKEGIEEHDLTQEIVRFVGESMLRNESYSAAHKAYRPTTFRELKATKQLHRIIDERRHLQALKHDLYKPMSPLHDAKPEPLDALGETRGLMDEPVAASRSERIHAKRKKFQHGLFHEEIELLDEDFANVIGEPSERALRLIAKHDDQVRKREALNRAQNRKKRPAEEKIADEIHMQNVRDNLVEHGPRDIDGYTWTDKKGHNKYFVTRDPRGDYTLSRTDKNGKRHAKKIKPENIMNVIKRQNGKPFSSK